MAVYKDFSEYELNNIKLRNVINIGWLGDAGSFPQGNVSDEFLMNLWEYYKCPVFSTRKIYQNVSLNGYWKFFTAVFSGREIDLGSSEIRVLDKEREVIYASPDLIIHYIVNHNYRPPQEYIKAVMEGPKPDSKDYCNMISRTYKHVNKIEGNATCPFCNSKCANYAYEEKRNCSEPAKLMVIEGDKVERGDEEDYVNYFMCKDCGHLYEYDLASLIRKRYP